MARKYRIDQLYIQALWRHNQAKAMTYFRIEDSMRAQAMTFADYSQQFESHFEGIFNAPSTVRTDDKLQSGAVSSDDVAET